MNLMRLLKRNPGPASNPPVGDLLQPLDDPFKSALLSMYRNEPQAGCDGQLHAIDKNTRITVAQGLWMYRLYCEARPKTSVEVGMAYGFSTMFLLAARAKVGSGFHTSIDPFQKTNWHGIALQKVAETRSETVSRFMENYSDHAAADFARAGNTFDYIFIDGNHRFDDVLLDFTLFARLCPPGGLIIFDDMWMPSVRTVASFIRTNRRDFAEVPSPISNIAVFRRTKPDDRIWTHFEKFAVARPA